MKKKPAPTTTQHTSITSSPKSKKKNVREVPSRFLQSAQKTDSKRGTTSQVIKDASVSLNKSFEVSESSTLPSTRNQSKPLVRPQRPSTSELKPLKQELREVELLQGQLLQWTYANACGELADRSLKNKAEEDMFDRGQQIVELKKQVNALDGELVAKRQTKLLDDVLSLEYSTLKPCEPTLQAAAESLQTLQHAAYFSLHRLALGEGLVVDPSALLSSLQSAERNLELILDRVQPETEEVVKLSADMKRLTDVVAEEREEIAKAAILAAELRKLYEDEKGAIAASAQWKREREIESLLREPLGD